MLLFSVVGSILLVTFIYHEFKNQRLFTYEHFVLVVISLLMIPFCGIMPALLLHFALALSGAIVWKSRKWSASSLRVYLIVAALPGYSIAIYFAAAQVFEQYRLRDQYVFESMEERLPVPKKTKPSILSEEMKRNLDELQASVYRDGDHHRDYALRRLHQNSLEAFINSPGFGVTRMNQSTDWSELITDSDERAVSQPGLPFQSALGENDFANEPKDTNLLSLRKAHLAGVLDFVNPGGFGQFESRQKVLAFQPHRFSKAPESDSLRIEAVELVSLLMHAEPMVYVSDKLPNMKDVRKGPKRLLNAFEVAALQKLREGEDLFLRDTSEGMRMLGAVRAIEQCVRCHDAERGDLLGAFSYSLQRRPQD